MQKQKPVGNEHQLPDDGTRLEGLERGGISLQKQQLPCPARLGRPKKNAAAAVNQKNDLRNYFQVVKGKAMWRRVLRELMRVLQVSRYYSNSVSKKLKLLKLHGRHHHCRLRPCGHRLQM
jgi:hypothetical protein